MHSCWFRRRFCRLPVLSGAASSAFSSALASRPDAGLVSVEDGNSAAGSDDATADAACRVWTDDVVETEEATSSSFNDPTFATNNIQLQPMKIKWKPDQIVMSH